MQKVKHALLALMVIYAIANGPEKLSEVPFRPKAHENIVLVEDLYLAFATDKAFSELIKLLWLSRKANSLILVGADVIDGRYHAEEAARKIKIVRMLSRTGVHCRTASSEQIAHS